MTGEEGVSIQLIYFQREQIILKSRLLFENLHTLEGILILYFYVNLSSREGKEEGKLDFVY